MRVSSGWPCSQSRSLEGRTAVWGPKIQACFMTAQIIVQKDTTGCKEDTETADSLEVKGRKKHNLVKTFRERSTSACS